MMIEKIQEFILTILPISAVDLKPSRVMAAEE